MRMPRVQLPPPAPAMPLARGQSLGVWRLGAPLPDGEEAHAGQWYDAQHAMAPEQHAAVLVLNRGNQSAGIMLRFADQVSDLARLNHPHIAVPSESGITADGHPYLIVEGDHGAPLLPQLHELLLRERLELMVDLCEALRAAHQHSWLLAEVDPAMVWRTEAGELRLMGLGLTRIPDPTDPFDRGQSLGSSPEFVAPECRAGAPPSLASEVYGLGALLRTVVCGWEDSPKGLSPRRGSVADLWPDLDEEHQIRLDALLRAATAYDVENRPVGAEAIADALRAWLGQRRAPVTAASPGNTRRPRRQGNALSAALDWWRARVG